MPAQILMDTASQVLGEYFEGEGHETPPVVNKGILAVEVMDENSKIHMLCITSDTTVWDLLGLVYAAELQVRSQLDALMAPEEEA